MMTPGGRPPVKPDDKVERFYIFGTPEEKAALKDRYEKEPEPKPKFGRWVVQKLLQLLDSTKKPQ